MAAASGPKGRSRHANCVRSSWYGHAVGRSTAEDEDDVVAEVAEEVEEAAPGVDDAAAEGDAAVEDAEVD